MPDVELGACLRREGGELSSSDGGERRREMKPGAEEGNRGGGDRAAAAETSLSVTISQQGSAEALKAGSPRRIGGLGGEKDGSLGEMSAAKKGELIDNYLDECRVCQEQSDEPLMNLGCGCRGELSKAHLSCIEMWFRTKGSNKCEICQQLAVNVPCPQSQASTNYWIWRVDPTFGGSSRRRGENRRGCLNPLWIAFCILVAGLLLDVLISVSFGVSALPVNIIIGILIVLGLGTALRVAVECFHEWNMQRIARRSAAAAASVDPPAFHPEV